MSRGYALLLLAWGALTAGLIFYSQTAAFAWDEGFHLLTAQLIFRGKTPYLDFFFPQTPLNAYWNALWMHVFGDTWRTAHAVAAVTTSLAVLFAADFTMRQTGRLRDALATLVLFGGNAMVVQFGPTGQAYGLCLLLIVVSFRLAIPSISSTSLSLPFLSGLLSAAAGSASLLTAPVAVVILLWIVFSNRVGGRMPKAVAFVIGAIAGSAPVWLLLWKDPHRTLFNVLVFNSKYRDVDWDNLWQHDLGVYLSAIDSAQALVLILFGFGAAAYLRGQRGVSLLCGLLAATLAFHISNAHPTFERYYLFSVPWLAMLAAMAIPAIPERLRRGATVLIFTLTLLGLGKSLFDERDSFTWSTWDQVAGKVAEVTPAHGTLQADEHVYLITRRVPPEGMEHENAHKPLGLPESELKALHILPRPQLQAQVRRGDYDTVETCTEGKPIDRKELETLYRNKWELEQCAVYWGFKR